MTIDAPTGRTSLSVYVVEEIRVKMTRLRVTGRELARRLNVSPSWVSYRLVGAQPIDLDDLARIAEALETSPVELLPRMDMSAIRRYPAPEDNRTNRRPADTRPQGHPSRPKPPPGPGRTSRVQRPAVI